MSAAKKIDANFRVESDSFGEIKVPADKYWGAQTQRSAENFRIGKDTFSPSFIAAYATLKKAASLRHAVQGRILAGKIDKL